MQFSITAPSGGELHAAILARKPVHMQRKILAALGRDGRGKRANATFDRGIFSATTWMNARSSLSHSLLRQKCALFSRAI